MPDEHSPDEASPDEASPDEDSPDEDSSGEHSPGEPAVEQPGPDGEGTGESGPSSEESGPSGDEDPTPVERGAGGPAGGSTAVARTTGNTPPPRPPRRTGVFLDPEDLREHVGTLLRVLLGGYEVDAWGNFIFTHEGARVFVTVGPTPIGPQVGVFSVTNVDIELTPPLAGFLLTANHRLGFGSFSYDSENEAVWLRHTLHGPTLDGPELQSAVAAVASAAAHFDDLIQERFGGRTFESAPEHVRRRAHPPDPEDQDQRPGPGASGYL